MDFEMVLELGTEIKMVKERNSILVEEKTNSLKPVSLSHHGRYSVLVGLK
jgi:hypothetical protein